jgi:hypothetical protein
VPSRRRGTTERRALLRRTTVSGTLRITMQ